MPGAASALRAGKQQQPPLVDAAVGLRRARRTPRPRVGLFALPDIERGAAISAHEPSHGEHQPPAEAPASPSALRRALARARDAKALDQAEAAVLLQARGDDLTTLLGHAARVRDSGLTSAGRPGVITYSRKVFIPLTRLCRDRCAYCTFVTVPGRVDSPYLSPDEVLQIARDGARLGCKEALFTQIGRAHV